MALRGFWSISSFQKGWTYGLFKSSCFFFFFFFFFLGGGVCPPYTMSVPSYAWNPGEGGGTSLLSISYSMHQACPLVPSFLSVLPETTQTCLCHLFSLLIGCLILNPGSLSSEDFLIWACLIEKESSYLLLGGPALMLQQMLWCRWNATSRLDAVQ